MPRAQAGRLAPVRVGRRRGGIPGGADGRTTATIILPTTLDPFAPPWTNRRTYSRPATTARWV